ncbi:MAG: ABC transporter permease, partial [Candidatus Omnitrophica bacterium]|nr:ABC transporter permease [Candidatus Omnitrophota bacterium]
MTGIIYVGTSLVNIFRYFSELLRFSGKTFAGIFKKTRRRNIIFKYVEEIGAGSLPLAGIISAFTGMVLVMETVTELKKFGAAMYTASIVSVSMVRELGPVLVGLIVSGRVGAAIAAELGTMKITEQIDA